MTSTVSVEIGPDGRGLVLARGTRWAFDLDLATGTAVLRGGRSGREAVRVRALRWREKLTLARFADQGDAFLLRAVATACASARPRAGPDDEAIAALAWWLEDPAGADGAAGDALDPRRLAAMTVELCQRTGLRPADLNELPAGEVTQLWQAVRSGTAEAEDAVGPAGEAVPRPLDAWDDATRIEVVDDPRASAAGGVEAGAAAPGPGRGSGSAAAGARPGSGSAAADPPGGAADHGAAGAGGSSLHGQVGAPAPDGGARIGRARVGTMRRHPTADARRPAVAMLRAASDPPILGGGGSADTRPSSASAWAVHGGEPGPAGPAPVSAPAPVPAARPAASRSVAAGRAMPAARIREDPPLPSPRAAWPANGALDIGPPVVTGMDPRALSGGPASVTWPASVAPMTPRSPSAAGPRPLAGPLTGSRAEPRGDAWDREVDADGRTAPLDRWQREALFQDLADELERATTLLGIGEDD